MYFTLSIFHSSLLKQHGVDVSNKDIENEKMVSKIKEQEKDIEILKEEISAVKNANSRTPSANMKRLVEQLRNQLSLKENQNQVIYHASNFFFSVFINNFFTESFIFSE